ncbi:hypothetical protein [Ralstonia solanacearum]|uniref:hypothetical protein n=1 Tax=Ralstonia solanacearum TaxID=305 RepID=UPI001FF9B0F8|nr:hypothetical protein [Ralstonia solanacearum]MDB0530352.1 hypothetical protein [Ralstonia solanacearum]MDB0560433.1 hypothetical protein [Ralstonia solanacearum]MDC6232689.1 hypothetical protein [Ralstonia solanacearum]MDC6262610.1 hypothetical protein [Ralstonia solanacearum]MDD7806261.1 hypothetical protein [Ralstonia solanacearum]
MIARLLIGTVRFAGGMVLWFLKRLVFCMLVVVVLALFARGAHAASVPVRSGSSGLTSWAVETSTLDRVVNATNAGVQIGRDIVARVGYGGKQIGAIAAMEVSAIGIADMAAVVARASTPVMVAMLVGDLALRGLQQCAGGGTGWCKRAPANPSEGDTGFNGFGWSYGYNTVSTGGGIGNGIAPSPGAACSAIAASDAYLAGQNARLSSMRPTGNGTSYECHFTNDGGSNFYAGTSQAGSCVSGYVLSGGACKPDPSVPASWLPVSYPDIAAAWNAQMVANPNRIPDYWKEMTPEQQAEAQKNAQRQPTRMSGSGSDSVSDPSAKSGSETKAKSDGTLQTCTTNTAVTVKARPNDSATAAASPLNYQTTAVDTTKCPDATTTTTTNSDTGNTGSSSQPNDSVSDTPFGDVPKLYDAKYKEGMLGVWKASKPNVQTTAFYQAIASMFPTVGGGSCPAFSLNLNVMAQGNYGVRSIDVPCSLFQTIGLIILATAAFTARKILF